MKTRMTLIATIVMVMFAGANMAFAKQKSHEDEYDQVNSYGDTTIAQDSASDWGPWKEFVQPAAGGPAAPFLAGGRSDPNPLPIVSQACPEGAACGYAVFKNFEATEYGYWKHHRYYTYWDYTYPDEGGDKKFGVFPATFTVYPEFGEPNKFGFGDLSGSFELVKMNPSDPDPTFSESGLVEGWYQYHPYFGPMFGGYGEADRYDETGGASIEGKVDGSMYTHGVGWQPSAVAVGDDLGDFKVYMYVTGQPELASLYCEGDCSLNQKMGVLGAYVVGVPTSAEQMSAMNTLMACYSGNELLSGARVEIGVNFNNATWNGEWSGYHQPYWTASGKVTGSNITSNALGGAAVSGLVQGTFYGSNAQNLAGVADVNLQSCCKGSEPYRHVDLFVTEQKFVGPAVEMPSTPQ